MRKKIDNNLSKRKKTIVYHINKYGYRGKTFVPQKTKETIRIIFLGGSHVFDIHAAEGQDWPNLVERYLDETEFRNVEVINAGIPGYASWDALGILYSEIHNYEPDYVIVCNAWNDIKYFRDISREKTLLRTYKPIEGKNPYMYYNSWIDKLLCSSQLYVRLRYRYYSGLEHKALVRAFNQCDEVVREVAKGIGKIIKIN